MHQSKLSVICAIGMGALGARALDPAVCTLTVSVFSANAKELLAQIHPDFVVSEVQDLFNSALVTVDYFNDTTDSSSIVDYIRENQPEGTTVVEMENVCVSCDQCAADVHYEDLPLCECMDEWTWR